MNSSVMRGIAVAIMVRSMQVWMEVAADAVLEDAIGAVVGVDHEEGGSDSEDDAGSSGVAGDDRWGKRRPVRIQRRENGRANKAWQRRDLGWGGAVKKVSGYYRWRGCPPELQFQRPG